MTTITAPESAPDRPVAGILSLSAAIGLFSIQDVVMKQLSGSYPVHEILFIRSLAAVLPILLIIAAFDGGFASLKIKRPMLHIARGLLIFVAYSSFYLALAALPLTVTVSLFFVTPMMITALSVVFFKIEVGLRRWSAIVVGFIGVLVILRPTSGFVDPAAGFALLAALSYAASTLVTRTLGAVAPSGSMALSATAVLAVISGLLWLFAGDGIVGADAHPSMQFLGRAWVMPSGTDLLLIEMIGGIAAIGFYLLSQAYRLAPPALVAPFEYLSLVWAMIWGFLFFSNTPDLYTIIGSALIVGSGLYMMRREAVLGRRVVAGRAVRPRI